ncbi:MAG: prepilin peptidase [Eubacteriaceae bacterium]
MIMMSEFHMIYGGVVFIFALTIGSFLNVLIYRMPLKISFLIGRSFCPRCLSVIHWYHNIPLVSFFALEGKCSSCQGKIPWRYPLIEVMTGFLGVFLFSIYGFSLQGLFLFLIGGILLCIAIIDYDTLTIPNGLIVGLMFLIAPSLILFPEVSLLSRWGGFLIVSTPMFLMTQWIPQSFGGGDIKLVAVMGAILGIKGIVLGTFIGIILGGITGGVILLKHSKDKKQKHMAFAPCLCLGIFTALVYGNEIISAYLKYIGLI